MRYFWSWLRYWFCLVTPSRERIYLRVRVSPPTTRQTALIASRSRTTLHMVGSEMNDVALIHKDPPRYMVTFGMHVGLVEPRRSVVEWRFSMPDDCWFAFCKTHGTCADACTVRVTAHRKSIGLADDK